MAAKDRVDFNGAGPDTSILPVGEQGETPPIPFPASAPVGTVLARLRPVTMDVVTFAVAPWRSQPAQLSLSGSTILKGGGAAAPGTVYEISVVALADGQAPSEGQRGSLVARFVAT